MSKLDTSQASAYARIRNNPKFHALVSKRSSFAWTLTAIVLVCYYSFMMVVAFAPTVLASPLAADGSIMTVAWPIGAVLIIGSWILTGVYIRRANSEFDELNQEILKECQ